MIKKIIFRKILGLYKNSSNRLLIEQDIDHWLEHFKWNVSYIDAIKKLFVEKPEYRNLFYYRIGNVRFWSRIIQFVFPPLPTLFITCNNIGGGLFILHGFATIIAAKKIGTHCQVNQQVTIGYNYDEAPEIGNNVKITCGAKVIGGVTVGNNVKIGANAVVIKDVPDNVTVVGVPAHIVQKKKE